jgi:hypothetical protein
VENFFQLENFEFFTENVGKFFRGPVSAVKPKKSFLSLARLPLGRRRGARRAPSSANCLAQPRDRQRQESIPADPGAHAAVNIDYLDASEHVGKRY